MASLGFAPDLALRRHRLFSSTDLDDTRDRIAAVMQPHRLTPRGRSPGPSHMDYLDLGAVGLGAIKFGPMAVEVPAVADYHLAVFCLSGRGAVRTETGTVTVDDRIGVLSNPGQPFIAEFSPDAEQFVLRIARRHLQAHLGRPARFHRRMDLARPELQPFLWQLRALAADTGLARLAQQNARLRTHIEALLLNLLIQGQPHATPNQATQISPASVRRAEAFIRAHAGEPLTLEQIAAASGVPARTLHESFRRFRGTTPLALLREIRLDQARDQLRTTQDSVADVALHCGFGHQGRFAQAYRARFGEPPSATRR